MSTAILAAVVVTPQAHAATTITELGRLPGHTSSSAYAINDSGVAVGTSGGGGSLNRPVKYDSAGVTELVGPPDRHTQLQAINNRGVSVGTATASNPDLPGRALRFAADGTYSVLAVPFGYWSTAAEAIDDFGNVYGVAAGRNNDLQIPVRWRSNGIVTTLKMPEGATWGRVTNASSNGYVTGMVSGPISGPGSGPWLNRLAVRWNPDGTVTSLQRLEDGAESEAKAVNRNGDVVGTAEFWNEGSFGVRWNADGSMTKYGPNLYPTAINDHGVAVGTGSTPSQQIPYRWSNDGEELDLGFPAGTVMANVQDINNDGVIVGGGLHACKWVVS
ncbi:hypothetical protein ACFWN2_21520 [Lentzea sp. NPDC058436]|uniref:hypothetical protein n=1 Tax=Lentzea sp. NPDC058436 TaxID=3346499 RepID=UPI00365EFFA3